MDIDISIVTVNLFVTVFNVILQPVPSVLSTANTDAINCVINVVEL
jgi:hypothetical protein